MADISTHSLVNSEENSVARKWRKEYQPKDEDGNPIGKPQVFEGDSEDELIDKLANAHMHATEAIIRLTHTKKLMDAVNSDLEAPITQSRELTSDEVFELSNDLLEPDKRKAALKRIAAAEIGESPDVVRKRIEESENRAMLAEVELFKAHHPEYRVCPENAEVISGFLRQYKMKPSYENLELAYSELNKAGVELLQSEPPEQQPESKTAEPVEASRITPPATTRPRQVATGLRPGQSKPTAGVSKPRLTKAEILNMPSDEYGRRMRNEPEFRHQVDEVLNPSR